VPINDITAQISPNGLISRFTSKLKNMNLKKNDPVYIK
jgi:hypothetical protein